MDRFIFLEDVRKSLSLKTKLSGAILAKCSALHIAEVMALEKIDENSPATILFTSGTESVPKGVPLSHKNILSNLRAALQCIDIHAADHFYAILPPFHSFGFSVACLFTLLGGIKVAFYPNPTDSHGLADGIDRWKITLLCSAPSFLKGLLSVAKPEQLKTMRYFISGAEKASPDLFEKVKQLGTGAKLLEGYGITECSPVLTITRPNLPPRGVGRLLPDIDLITIHPETLAPQPSGTDGEICVRGANIFQGYLGNPRTPFIDIEGKQWYRTGDLGHLESDGTLVLSGRLKRFAKLGGEMISLGAVEETLHQVLLRDKRISQDVASLAICIDESKGQPQLVLFIIIDIDRDEVNQILQRSGFSSLVKVSQVKKVQDIPLMGAGKTDYRNLQSQIKSNK
jgi:long-chain-fatty-acid--[acyl-carrier-protein] ligase